MKWRSLIFLPRVRNFLEGNFTRRAFSRSINAFESTREHFKINDNLHVVRIVMQRFSIWKTLIFNRGDVVTIRTQEVSDVETSFTCIDNYGEEEVKELVNYFFYNGDDFCYNVLFNSVGLRRHVCCTAFRGPKVKVENVIVTNLKRISLPTLERLSLTDLKKQFKK